MLTSAFYTEYIKNNLSTTWRKLFFMHLQFFLRVLFVDTVGSCSMLPREKQGVVDFQLKVHSAVLEFFIAFLMPVLGLWNDQLACLRYLYHTTSHCLPYTECGSHLMFIPLALNMLPDSNCIYDRRKRYVLSHGIFFYALVDKMFGSC